MLLTKAHASFFFPGVLRKAHFFPIGKEKQRLTDKPEVTVRFYPCHKCQRIESLPNDFTLNFRVIKKAFFFF